MAETENLLFDRNDPVDDHNDIWDDTALIEAYDNAVNVVKSHIDAKKVVNSEEPTEMKQKPKEKKKKQHRKKPNKLSTWKPGQRCRAVYSEDGETYEGIIRSVNADDGTCVVRYLGYGNEESQNLDDLLPSAPAEEKNVEGTSDSDAMEWNGPSPRSAKGPPVRNKRSDTEEPAPFPMPPMFPLMQNPMAQGGFPSQMPAFPPMNGSAPFLPPPPSFEMIDDIASDKEALYSMLISWYMSGYHTGFYQGLQKSRRSDVTRSSPQSSNTSKRPKDISHRR